MKRTETDLENIKRYCISNQASLRKALIAINDLSGESRTLFVLDDEEHLEGTVTDGDLRRALIAGLDLDDIVTSAMHRNYLAIREGESSRHIIADARKLNISLLPILDASCRIQKIIDLRHTGSLLPLDAVLMAGGRGERLRPLTLTCPKPLLKVGDKHIIDYNVEELVACGIEHITATVNYLHEMIEDHFSRPVAGVKVNCVLEPRRLGTMGSLSLVPRFYNDNVLIMNSDLLTTLDFEQMFYHHIDSDADMTVATIPYNVSVPFAVLDTSGNRVTGLSEKPTFNYMANAGVYIVKRKFVEQIAKGEYLDATDFIQNLIENGCNVSHFMIDGIWIDIGSPSDYEYANSLMSRPGRR